MEITIPGTDLDGASLVVFESLYHGDAEVALHADLEDEGQTVTYGYPDLPLPPTGGTEEPEPQEPEPSQAASPAPGRLAQTGDNNLIPIGIAALAACFGGALAWHSFRNRHK